MCGGENAPLPTCFTDEAQFYLNRHTHKQNKRYQSADNPKLLHDIPLYDIKVGEWRAINASRKI
jgi:hypothetical protein